MEAISFIQYSKKQLRNLASMMVYHEISRLHAKLMEPNPLGWDWVKMFLLGITLKVQIYTKCSCSSFQPYRG